MNLGRPLPTPHHQEYLLCSRATRVALASHLAAKRPSLRTRSVGAGEVAPPPRCRLWQKGTPVWKHPFPCNDKHFSPSITTRALHSSVRATDPRLVTKVSRASSSRSSFHSNSSARAPRKTFEAFAQDARDALLSWNSDLEVDLLGDYRCDKQHSQHAVLLVVGKSDHSVPCRPDEHSPSTEREFVHHLQNAGLVEHHRDNLVLCADRSVRVSVQ